MASRGINVEFCYKGDVIEPISSLGAVGFYYGPKDSKSSMNGFVTKDIDQAKRLKEIAEKMINHLEKKEVKK